MGGWQRPIGREQQSAPSGASAACLDHLRGEPERQGALCAWRDGASGCLAFEYPEITGYALTYLASRLNLVESECRVGTRAADWLATRLAQPDLSVRPHSDVRLRALLAQQRAGLVHPNAVGPVNRAAILAARSLGLPIVDHVRGLDPLTWLDRHLMRAVDGFIFISRAVAEQQRQAGAHIRCGHVAYNGLDLASFPLDVPAVTLRQALQIPADAYLVGSVGRLVAWKGYDVAVRAVARLCCAGVPAHLLVVGGADVGEPGYAQELHGLAVALGIEAHVTFAGYRDDIPRVMGTLDVFVHCAVAPEPFGRAVIEAMPAQRPVVGSAAGGVLEIIRPGVDGMLTPPGDVDALAAAIVDLWQHPQKAQLLAEAGRVCIGTEFTQVRYVAGVEGVYAAVMSIAGGRE